MSDKKLSTLLTIVIFLLLIVAPITIGLLTHNGWVGGLAFLSLVMLLIGFGTSQESRLWTFVVCFIAALGLMAWASWLGHLANPWLWIILWLACMLGGQIGWSDLLPFSQRGSFLSYVWLILIGLTGFITVTIPVLFLPLTEGGKFSTPDLLAWGWVAAGLICLAVAWGQAKYLEPAVFFIFLILGTIFLAVAVTRIGLPLSWSWAGIWLLAAFLAGSGARENKDYNKTMWITGLLFTGVFIFAAIGGPFVSQQDLPLRKTPLTDAQAAATRLAEAQAQATQAMQAELAATQVQQTAVQQTAQAATQIAQQALIPTETPRPPEETLTNNELAATQLAEAIGTATAAAGGEVKIAPSPTLKAAKTPAPKTAATGSGGVEATKTLLGAVIRSFWGIANMIVLFILGSTYIKRWGGFLFWFLFLAAVWMYGGNNSEILSFIVHEITSSPATWASEVMSASFNESQTVGWGVLVLGFVPTILLMPAYWHMLRYNQNFNRYRLENPFIGNETMQRYIQRNTSQAMRSGLAAIAIMFFSLGLPVAVWMGLRRFTALTPPVDLSFFFIPSLAVPHWKPVWSIWYAIPPILAACLNFTLNKIQKRYLLTSASPLATNPMIILISAVLMFLFIPAGVVFFSIAQSLSMTLLVPLILRVPVIVRPRPPITPQPPPVIIEKPKPIVIGSVPSDPPKPKLAGEKLFELVSGLCGVVPGEADHEFFILDEGGEMNRVVHGSYEVYNGIPIDEPAGLFHLKDGSFLAVGSEGKLVKTSLQKNAEDDSEFIVESELEIAGRIDAFALNSFGTLLAYISPQDNQIKGFFLTNQREQVFSTLEDLAPVMAFSENGRFLAVGTTLGEIHIIDIATRQVTHRLVSAENKKAVSHLARGINSGWVSVISGTRLVTWDKEGLLIKGITVPAKVTSLTLNAAGDQIYLGCQDGYARLYNLSCQFIAEFHTQEEAISQILLSSDEDLLFTVAEDTTFYEVSL